MSHSILVLAVHPDDETLGAGGTLLKHRKNGDHIHWLIATQVEDKNSENFKTRQKEIEIVSDLYNFDSVHYLGLSTMRVDEYSMKYLVDKISKVIQKIEPSVLYLPFKHDIHSDHRKIFDAAFSCSKSFRYPYLKTIYMMEILSETEFAPSSQENAFIPNVFVDITQFIDEKIKIMQIFKNEIEDHPFPRSIKNIEALATFRGAIAGCKYAESFMLLKKIQ